MSKPKRPRRNERKRDCARPELEREQTVVEIVFGDSEEPPKPDETPNPADNASQNASPQPSNRFLFRF